MQENRSPVAFFIFNRPDPTRRVFEVIRQARPSRLFVIADGPRNSEEKNLCEETRLVTETIDWPCEAVRIYSETNLGCKERLVSGLNQVFDQTESAIILEDDCLPDPSFFPFCDELLKKYRFSDRIGSISGCNFQFGANPIAESYYFSRFCHIWGWATWRRAWKLNDPHLIAWPQRKKEGWLKQVTADRTAQHYWKSLFDDSYENCPGGLGTWDVAWSFSCWHHNLLSIIPCCNLVSNIGYGAQSTHTYIQTKMAAQKNHAMMFPLQHPAQIEVFSKADLFSERTIYYGITPWQKFFWKSRLPLSLSRARQIQSSIHRFYSKLKS